MKIISTVLIVACSLFFSNISFAVRSFSKTDAPTQQPQQTKTESNSKYNPPAPQEQNYIMKNTELDEITEDVEEGTEETGNIEQNNDNIIIDESEEAQETITEQQAKEKLNPPQLNPQQKKPKEEIIKPKINGSGEYETF